VENASTSQLVEDDPIISPRVGFDVLLKSYYEALTSKNPLGGSHEIVKQKAVRSDTFQKVRYKTKVDNQPKALEKNSSQEKAVKIATDDALDARDANPRRDLLYRRSESLTASFLRGRTKS